MVFDINYSFCILYNETLNTQNCFRTVMALSKGRVIYSLASELINKKWSQESCNESASEVSLS